MTKKGEWLEWLIRYRRIVGVEELLACTDWKHAPYGALRVREIGGQGVELTIDLSCEPRPAWAPLRGLWLQLPPHPNILSALDPVEPAGVSVAYAAIDWTRPLATDAATLVAYGTQLARAYAHVQAHVGEADLGRFCRPRVHVDLGGNVRIAFLPCGPWLGNEMWPSELRRTWPRATPATLVHVIATQIAVLAADITAHAELREVVTRSIDARPTARPPNPRALCVELERFDAADVPVRAAGQLAGWNALERGIGWLATAFPRRALKCFEAALDTGHCLAYAQVGRAVSRAQLGEEPTPWVPTTRDARRRDLLAAAAKRAWEQVTGLPWYAGTGEAWETVAELGAKCEAQGAFAEAIAWYHRASPSLEQELALARAYAANRLPGLAIDYARRVRLRDPAHQDVLSILIRALLAYGDPTAALIEADALIAVTPDDGHAHYLRGRCLLALSRLPDAHAAFDRACVLSPKLLEAMLLRREAGRIASIARAQAGSPDDAVALPADASEDLPPDTELDADTEFDAALGTSDSRLAAIRLRDIG